MIIESIAILIGIGVLINKVGLRKEAKVLKPKGQMVEVDGGEINVYSEGKGRETIVILAGFGVPLPQAEYGPLMRELKDQYKVVICDYKGLGFSSLTDKPRNNENIVEETREALRQAGFKPPYILMPHSIGGVYSEYYTSKYPEEITGIVMLDGTPSVVPNKPMPTAALKLFKISKILQSIGFTRLQLKLVKLPYSTDCGYTQEEVGLIRTFVKRCINDTMINQGEWIPENIKEVEPFTMPNDIPVLKIISKQTAEAPEKQWGMKAMDYQQKHLDKLGSRVSHEILDCKHNMHQTHAKQIGELAKAFIEKSI